MHFGNLSVSSVDVTAIISHHFVGSVQLNQYPELMRVSSAWIERTCWPSRELEWYQNSGDGTGLYVNMYGMK